MSEIRDETTGQFTAAPVPETITEQREQAAGYEPLVLPDEAPAEDTPLTVEEASLELTASRTPESDIKSYSPLDVFSKASIRMLR